MVHNLCLDSKTRCFRIQVPDSVANGMGLWGVESKTSGGLVSEITGLDDCMAFHKIQLDFFSRALDIATDTATEGMDMAFNLMCRNASR